MPSSHLILLHICLQQLIPHNGNFHILNSRFEGIIIIEQDVRKIDTPKQFFLIFSFNFSCSQSRKFTLFQ
ncbi:hypothetical protein K7X08_030143 [Anisodus acutangulus]|uniref:Uncharacterized protein n=1 Tax=Anisodus acutangulus TaxID=402998 RepID=A0A9Q1LP83_9SOLA|nr:hypothetical protein K7X08_030143 [Anisodus acutangulus]